MTGQNVGADNFERAAQTNYYASQIMFAILTISGIVTLVAAESIMSAFTDDPAVISAGVTFLRYVAPTFGFTGIMYAYTGGFRGTGRTLVAAAITILTLGVIRVPIAWGASSLVGSSGMWFAFAVSNVAGAAIAYVWFRRNAWRTTSVISNQSEPEPVSD